MTEHCAFGDVLKDVLKVTNGELDPAIRQSLEDYFSIFAKPDKEGKCIKCGTVQGGLMALIRGGFTYDLCHGEGHCSKCGWPARANHYPKDKDGKEIGSMRMILQYHPDEVIAKEVAS